MTYKRSGKKLIKKIVCVSLVSVIVSTGCSFSFSNADERNQNPVYSYEGVTSGSTDSNSSVSQPQVQAESISGKSENQGNYQPSNGQGEVITNNNSEVIKTDPFDFNGTKLTDNSKSVSGITAESNKFDPREFNLMTSIKNQLKLGICWSFAGNAALESFLKKSNIGTYDLSEEHMRWWAKDGTFDWKIGDSEGSTNETSMGYFTSWQGPKLESDIPYNGNVTTDEGAKKPANFDSAPRLGYNVLDVVNVATDRSSVKNAILKYGAITSGYYDDAKYMSQDSTAFYCDESLGQTHAIAIVGWDDNFSKDRFTGKVKPKSNGAWLIKNSWGNYNKESGYLWISYEDKTLLSYSDNYAIARVQKDKGQKIYQHEYSMSSTLSSDVVVAANKFNFGQNEVLQGVMFATDSIGAKYEIYYVPEENGTPSYNKRMLIKSGVVPFSGYITADVDNYILPTGNGSICVKIDNSSQSKKSSIGLEKNVKNYKMFVSKANYGQSYILSKGRLVDLNRVSTYYPSNVVIKGITKGVGGANILAGQDRYETAIKVSVNGWSSAENVFLVNGGAIADALTSTPLAKLLNAPILLTEKGSINKNVMNEIKRLGAKTVVIIGGENSISSTIVNELKKQGFGVERIYGQDRFETSNKIAQKILSVDSSKVNAYAVVNGYKGLADAISFSPVSGEKNIPIILSDEKGKVDIPSELKSSDSVLSSYIIGGESSVPQSIESELKNPARVSGLDRNDTNAKIIERFYTSSELKQVFVAKDGYGNQGMLIDGLAIGAYAAGEKSPIVLTHGRLSAEQKRVLEKKKIDKIVQVGNGNNSMAVTELLLMKDKQK